MELSAGTLICGRFELLREESPNTGVPAFGPTWAVLDTETGEPARACLLDAALLPSVEQRKAFIRAIAEYAEIRDPSLVPQVYVGEEGEHAVVCYDPLAGAFALGDLYDGTGAVDVVGESGRLARQLARALAGLHARGRVHGMLACEAVFVGPQGPAVFQHGFAPLCARAELERRCRAFHMANLAFETRGSGAFTPSADVFAWGATLAQFVTGQRGEAALRASEPAGLPSGLWALIKDCLAEEPAARPRDGAEVLRRLEAANPTGAEAGGEAVAPPAPIEVPPPAPAAPSQPAAPKVPVSGDSKPAEAEERARAAPSKAFPVTSFEEMLLTSDRTHRPATVPPGSLVAAAVSATGSHGVVEGDPKGARSSSGLRRVHVLTEDAIVRTNRPSSRPPSESHESSDVIIGGTRAEMEAASRAPTRKLDPTEALEAAAQAVAGAPESTPPKVPAPPAVTPTPPAAAAAAASTSGSTPAKPADTTFWWILAGLIVAVILALSLR